MSHHLVGTAEIAKLLGVSRQRVAQIVDSYPDFPKPEAELSAGRVWSRSAVETWMTAHPDRLPGRAEGETVMRKERGFLRGIHKRFTDEARRAVVSAQEEARSFHHNYIGTEHLLLGVVTEGGGVADALSEHGCGLEELRTGLEERVGYGKSQPEGHIPFTPRAKKALEHALREALRLGENEIRCLHLLLGLLRDPDGLAVKLLEDAGVYPGKLRESLLERQSPRFARVKLTHTASGSGQSMDDLLQELRAIRERLESLEARIDDLSRPA